MLFYLTDNRRIRNGDNYSGTDSTHKQLERRTEWFISINYF